MEKFGKEPSFNDKGQVAMKKVRQMAKTVHIPPNKYYNFIPKHGICFCWVDEEDVQTVLDIKRSCCGGQQVQQFYLARFIDIGIHERR